MSGASAAEAKQALPGAVIAGRYRLIGRLGEGGMGQVFEAEHVELGRRFALKVLKLDKWSDALVARFRREAQALARLSTPHVAQVTDFGVDGEVGPFYVMELVEGETLEGRLERGVLTPTEAARIGKATASALAEVHASGLVHRDLKPSNIALPGRGPIDVKLLDFGLVAAVDDSFMTRITKSQQVLGSLPYMPPEAFNGAAPSPAMDLYALGVSLYEGISGGLPFFAPSTAAMIHQILTAPVPPLVQRVERVPPELCAVLERLLSKDPTARYPNAAAAEAAFARILEGGALPSVPPTVLAPAAPPPTVEAPPPHPRAITSPVGATAATSPSVPPPTSTSTESLAGAIASPTRFVLGAFVAGVVLAGIAAVAVVMVLSAGDTPATSGASPQAPETVAQPVAPATPPAVVTAAPPDPAPSSVAREDDPENDEAEAPSPTEAREVAPRAAGMRRGEPAPRMEPMREEAAMEAPMHSTWRGDRAIVDDSEFD